MLDSGIMERCTLFRCTSHSIVLHFSIRYQGSFIIFGALSAIFFFQESIHLSVFLSPSISTLLLDSSRTIVCDGTCFQHGRPCHLEFQRQNPQGINITSIHSECDQPHYRKLRRHNDYTIIVEQASGEIITSNLPLAPIQCIGR